MTVSAKSVRASESRLSRRLLLRVTLPVAGVGLLLLCLGVYGAWRVHRLQIRGTELVANHVASVRAGEDLETAARGIRYQLRQAAMGEAGSHLAEARGRLGQLEQRISRLESLSTSPREQDLVRRIRGGQRELIDGLARAALPPPASEIEDAYLLLAEDVIPNKILAFTAKHVEWNEAQISTGRDHNEATAQRLIAALLLLGILGGTAGLLAGYGIARGVSRRLVQLSLPIQDAAGALGESFGSVTVSADPQFRDLETVLQRISERVSHVVRQLHESQHETLRAEQLAAVGHLAAGMAHELRNPLTAMKAILQEAEAPGDLDHRDLAVLREETERLEKSVQTFIEFARPPQLDKQRDDVAAIVKHVVRFVTPLAERREIILHSGRLQQPVIADVDAVQIRQLVLNLINERARRRIERRSH